MENLSFKRAPVIELVAELRWSPPGQSTTTVSASPGTINFALNAAVDEFFQRFGNEVAKVGFTQAEKLVPSGFPPLWHHVMWRYRKPGDTSTLLQIGPGLFSANALQPYRRWKEFRPTVLQGVEALLKTRSDDEKNLPFSGVSLRYINAFTTDLLVGKRPADFISDVLGLKLSLPPAIESLIDLNGHVNSSANVLIPIANTTKNMALAIGDGKANTDEAAMLDVTVAERNPTASSSNAAMSALDASRDIIHGCFLQMVEPLKDVMKPVVG